MTPSPSVLMLEFNELTPRLMDRFIAEGHLPNFERLRSESTVMITDPEEDQDGLEPWIQWVTVHTGVGRAEHGIEKLGEADQLAQKTIGEVVADSGGDVWLCGSMNLPQRAAGGGWYLPDPWNPDSTPRPESLAPFVEFVRANVQEHSNASARLGLRSLGRFGWYLSTHGLSTATARAALRQLVAERRGGRGRWARASVLDRFQWDVFRHHWRRTTPSFATFFSNSTAHYQHLFWRNLEPERFTNQPTTLEQTQLAGAVLHGYREMDRIVGEAIALADRTDATVMFCTGLSQQPYLQAEEQGGKYIYRPHQIAALLDWIGLAGVHRVAPVMAEQFHIFFADAAAGADGLEALDGVTISGRRAFSSRLVDHDVFTGCAVHDALDDSALIETRDGRTAPFGSFFYRSEAPKSGFHHPDGMWWVRTGEHHEFVDRVSLRSVARTVLDTLELPVPASMASRPSPLTTR